MISKKAKKEAFIVVPAYNEEKYIGIVIDELKKEGYKNIIVVSDGSKDRTDEIAKKKKVILLRHLINRGLGATLKTGITAALMLGAKYIVTFDGDHQHYAEDIEKLLKPLIDGKAEVVIGSRFISEEGKRNTPLKYRIGNFGLNIISWLLFGIYCTDTQSGLRAFNRAAAKKINITKRKMAVSSEIIAEIKRKKLRMVEVPINVRYPHQRQGIVSGIRIIYRLILKRLGL